jgi:subtilisin family serine protease
VRPGAAARAPVLLALAAALGACAPRSAPPAPAAAPASAVAADATGVAREPAAPLLPPQAARLLGLLPRRTVGAEQFIAEHPHADGRGVLIGILDSGVDPGVPGLRTTTTGAPKILDVRDFSGEGRIPLRPLTPVGDMVTVDGIRLRGVGRVRALATGTIYGGVLVERRLGGLPAADVNGDGDHADSLALVVARASDGWFVIADTDGDGSLAGESPVRDFAVGGDTFAFGPLTLAANLRGDGDDPVLDLVFDTSGHGTHVAGIAAGHGLFGVEGFDGLAPGAQLLGLKISNNARGGISVTGSMARAMEYAAQFAARRGMPLVLNLSFGIGNEGGATQPVIDSIIDAFALRHPEVVFVISAGNDGPGLSTVGFPGSADFALSTCALFPGVFAKAPNTAGPPAEDVIGWWSARGGVFQKPDLCVPGVAFSNVPEWQTGEEVSGGTSMAAPQLAGVVALLQSALLAGGRAADAATIGAALRATARPIAGATWIDAGAGIPNVAAAFRWLGAGHRAGRFAVRAAPDGANAGFSAAYRRAGLAPGDTIQHFAVASAAGQPFAQVLLRPDATWLRAPPAVTFAGGPVTVPVTYDANALREPGLYVGTAWARPASDTLAGAVFGLTSTIVVPHTLERPLRLRQHVPRGRSHRIFLDVPAPAAGFVVRAHVSDGEQAVSLYLFEPTAQPQRSEFAVEIGGPLPATGEIAVRADDVVPGVYEVVLVAPPTRGATVDLTAELSPFDVAGIGDDGVLLRNRTAAPLDASASVRGIGAGRQFRMRGGSRVAARERLRLPAWTRKVRIDVTFPTSRWPAVTDVGVTLWDTTGYFVDESPLNRAFGRHVLTVGAAMPRVLDLEVMPGFARPDDDSSWEAEVVVVYLPEQPPAPAMHAPLPLSAGATALVSWPDPLPEWIPPGLSMLTEIRVLAPSAPTTVLQALHRPTMASE